MENYESIRTFAMRVNNDLEHLDIAVLNAGIISPRYEQSTYDYEKTLQINTLSTVLLALFLLPKLKASQTNDFTPVLELVSSSAHLQLKWSDIDKKSPKPLERFNNAANFGGEKQYGTSKLFLMCALPQLVKLTGGSTGKSTTHVISVCPGPTRSDIFRNYMTWWLKPIAAAIFALFFRDTNVGARTYVSGVFLGETGNGGFWTDDKLQP